MRGAFGSLVVLAVGCSSGRASDAGLEAGVADARVVDAMPDAWAYDACTPAADAGFDLNCATGADTQIHCPADAPYCVSGCLECGYFCQECCESVGDCIERLPDDALVQQCSLQGDPGCPSVMPICCEKMLNRVCYDRPLRGWDCNP